MDVQIHLGMKIFVDAQLRRVRADIGYCRLGALLHHVAQFAGQLQLAAALHGGGLDGQNFAADRRPGKACHAPDQGFIFNLVVHGLNGAQQLMYLLFVDTEALFPVHLGDSALAAHCADGALQRAHACLGCVIADDGAQRAVLQPQEGLGQPVFLQLLGSRWRLAISNFSSGV